MTTNYQPAERPKAILSSNGIAAAVLFGLFVVTFLFNFIIGAGILGTAPFFSLFMLIFSLLNIRFTKTLFTEAFGWFISIIASWALTAPVSSAIDNALIRADPSVTFSEPLGFNIGLYYWAIIPVAVYVIVGIVRYWRDARNS